MIPSTVQPVLVVTGTCPDCGTVESVDIVAAAPLSARARDIANRDLSTCECGGTCAVTETTGFVPVEL